MRPPTTRTARGAVHTVAVSGIIALAAAGLAACGSDTPTGAATAPREAAGLPNADGVCPERASNAVVVRVQNAVPGAVTFRVPIGDIDCFDWSGVSTPYTAFNRQSVGFGRARQFRLEVARRGKRSRWTMQMHTVGTKGEADGTTRMLVVGGSVGASGGRSAGGEGSSDCAFTPVAAAPPGWRDTPESALDFSRTNVLTISVRGGQVGYFFCTSGETLKRF